MSINNNVLVKFSEEEFDRGNDHNSIISNLLFAVSTKLYKKPVMLLNTAVISDQFLTDRIKQPQRVLFWVDIPHNDWTEDTSRMNFLRTLAVQSSVGMAKFARSSRFNCHQTLLV